MEWNESNFDIDRNPFAKEAYQVGKFAFVADYVRLCVLKEYGGIYLDTDVEILKPLDSFLHHPAFMGFENQMRLQTALIASEKNGVWVSEILKYYEGRHFLDQSGNPEIKTNTEIITEIMLEKGLQLNNKLQEIQGVITVYPKDYFCPKDYRTEKIKLTENSYALHHFAQSWKDRESVVARFIRKHPVIDRWIVNFNALLKKIFGPKWQSVTTKIRRTLGLPTKK